MSQLAHDVPYMACFVSYYHSILYNATLTLIYLIILVFRSCLITSYPHLHARHVVFYWCMYLVTRRVVTTVSAVMAVMEYVEASQCSMVAVQVSIYVIVECIVVFYYVYDAYVMLCHHMSFYHAL